MLYFWKVKIKSFFIMKGEIRNISGIRHSQAFIWGSADMNHCSEAAKVEMPFRAYPEPCVSHRGRFPSSKGALLEAAGEGSKGEQQFCSAQLSCRSHCSRLSYRNHQGSAAPARLRPPGHVFGGWGTLLREEFHLLLFLLLHKRFVSCFSQNTLLGFSYCTLSVSFFHLLFLS